MPSSPTPPSAQENGSAIAAYRCQRRTIRTGGGYRRLLGIPIIPGDQSSSRHWIAWCIMSPVTTARWAREEILTQLWQGVTGRRRQPDGVIQSGSSSIVGRKEILRPSPWPLAFNHRVNGNVADSDLPHCRFLLGGDRNSLVIDSAVDFRIDGSAMTEIHRDRETYCRE